MAELKTYSSQAKKGGGKIHFGATSMDIEDNADIINFKKALNIIEDKIIDLLKEYTVKINANKDLVCMAYTHLQPAEPTTLGYRFSLYAQDLLQDLKLLNFVKLQTKGKGTKGAVGTYASYYSLISRKAQNMEEDVLKELGIKAFDVANQVYPRKLDYLILTLFSSIAQSLYKFSLDVRILQSQGFGELMEPFGKKQVGSSAMPFKRNPIVCEKICSISRFISSLPQVAWGNAADSALERTLDDSASRRIILPEAFLATDEILNQSQKVLKDLTVNKKNIQKNLDLYGPFSALETLLMQAVKNGANRQEFHEVLRKHALKAYKSIEEKGKNNLFKNLKSDPKIINYLSEKEIQKTLNYENHIGLASQKSTQMVKTIKEKLEKKTNGDK